MAHSFTPRRFTGCILLGRLGQGGVYLTDVELSPWGLLVILRHLDDEGLPVPEPQPGPGLPIPPLALVQLEVSSNRGRLEALRSGTLGSLAEGIAIHRFDASATDPTPLQLDIHLRDSPLEPAHVEL